MSRSADWHLARFLEEIGLISSGCAWLSWTSQVAKGDNRVGLLVLVRCWAVPACVAALTSPTDARSDV